MAYDLNAFAVLVGVAWAVAALWLVATLLTLRGLRQQKPLRARAPNRGLTTEEVPFVSILVPARNEAQRVLAHSIGSMLAQDYGHFEIVAVDDRSTDTTNVILRSIAERHEKLRVIAGRQLPAGWLGKPHALHQALAAARGEWVLATDADMLFEPQAVRMAMSHALANHYDAVTLLPHVVCRSFWERVFMPAFGWFMLMAMPLERVNDPDQPQSLGVGGFFLIRRAPLERVGGYRAVRDDVAEDLRMAEILKKAGARVRVEYAPDLISTRMQTNLREIWEGFTKNLFAGAKFSFGRAAAGAVAVLLFSIAPACVALFCALMLPTDHDRQGGWASLLAPTATTWVLQIVTFALVNKNWGIPAGYALTMPLGHALFVAILLNSAVLIATGRGVTWKGRKLYERAGGVRPPRRRTEHRPDEPSFNDE